MAQRSNRLHCPHKSLKLGFGFGEFLRQHLHGHRLVALTMVRAKNEARMTAAEKSAELVMAEDLAFEFGERIGRRGRQRGVFAGPGSRGGLGRSGGADRRVFPPRGFKTVAGPAGHGGPGPASPPPEWGSPEFVPGESRAIVNVARRRFP